MQVDENLLKAHFPLPHVLKEMFSLYELLFSLRFVEVEKTSPEFSVWHEDVRQFDCFDAASNEKLGSFYLDLHPRDGVFFPSFFP